MNRTSGSGSGHEQDNLKINEELENRKLKLEWFKALTSVPLIAVPLIAVLITGFLAYREQVQKARDDFALKAAEIVLNAETPYGAKNKASVLKEIFPERLPDNFAATFDPGKLPNRPDSINKTELLRILSEKVKNPAQIIEFTKMLFPGDPLIKDSKAKN